MSLNYYKLHKDAITPNYQDLMLQLPVLQCMENILTEAKHQNITLSDKIAIQSAQDALSN